MGDGDSELGRLATAAAAAAASAAGIIKLKSPSLSPSADLTGKVHQLPCCIKYDGPSAVSDYFKPKLTGVEVDGLKAEEACFRGRKLMGATLPLPPGFSGFVLGKKSLGKRKASDLVEQQPNCWEMNAKFENVTYWNHDNMPSQQDAFFRTFHWLSVAQALHKPVTAEDLASTCTTLEKN